MTSKLTDEELLPEKTLVAHKDLILQKIIALATVNPNWALREAVLHILKGLPNSISPAMLLELTCFTFDQWESVASAEKVVPA